MRSLMDCQTGVTCRLIGFVRSSGVSTPHLAADVENAFCCITFTLLDDQPIARFRKLLLVVATGSAQNTGSHLAADGKTAAEWNKGPLRIEPVIGTVTLRKLDGAKSVTATPLSSEGRSRSTALRVERRGNDWTLKLGERATT